MRLGWSGKTICIAIVQQLSLGGVLLALRTIWRLGGRGGNVAGELISLQKSLTELLSCLLNAM